MKKLLVGVVAAAVVAFTGCSGSSSSSGGKTSNAGGPGSVVKTPEGTFELDTPSALTVKQGDDRGISIGIKKGKNVDVDVALTFKDPPKGISFDPEKSTIKHGEGKVDVKMKVAADAATGAFDINVTGHPDKGDDAHGSFKVTVEKK